MAATVTTTEATVSVTVGVSRELSTSPNPDSRPVTGLAAHPPPPGNSSHPDDCWCRWDGYRCGVSQLLIARQRDGTGRWEHVSSRGVGVRLLHGWDEDEEDEEGGGSSLGGGSTVRRPPQRIRPSQPWRRYLVLTLGSGHGPRTQLWRMLPRELPASDTD
ncbi:protein UL155 [Panine betaherpesvirus 2]|uniref:Protein UL155 n=1 Tax=Panine betaherpesvirus 2 TaxID=188763 RepID=Q8QRW0_9BETA|nr:protein UL155 [Panine betaherpesvirus 2]AAM00778.1 protein UL155 [Panine betaherpesvirus 2]QXV67894.1 protein UL155 [Panine betaherpesvirus 2]